MERIFIGLPCPPSLQQSLETLRAPLEGARWVHPHDYHLTLYFIGEVSELETNRLVDELEGIDFTSFSLRPKGVQVFGPLERPKALFSAVDDIDYLLELQQWVSKIVQQTLPTLERDKRRFVPHITLARFGASSEAPGQSIGAYLEANSLYHGPSVEMTEFGLYISKKNRSEGQPRYQLLKRFELH